MGNQIFFKMNVVTMRHQIVQKSSSFCLFVCLMVFNATFNNISVISWR